MKAFALAIIIGMVGLLLVGMQQYQVLALRAEVQVETKGKNDAIKANQESQLTITTLRDEAKRNATYTADLAQRIKASEDEAKQARKEFETLKRSSKPVRDWAAQPLPNGLRGKAPGSDKDKRPKN